MRMDEMEIPTVDERPNQKSHKQGPPRQSMQRREVDHLHPTEAVRALPFLIADPRPFGPLPAFVHAGYNDALGQQFDGKR